MSAFGGRPAASAELTAPMPTPVAVAFCPSPPLLLPEVEGRPADDTETLRSACDAAVDAMLAARPDTVVVVGERPADGGPLGPGDAGDLRGFGVDLVVPFAGPAGPGGRRVPLAHTVGAWLLDRAGSEVRRVGVGPDDLTTAMGGLDGRVGLLVMGDGSARRTVKAPGYLDDAAEPFDAAVADALASGNAAGLAALDPVAGERLLAAGVPAWRAVGAALQGRRVTACLGYDAAPYGVGYLVADWVVA